jgi:hypothetical protein
MVERGAGISVDSTLYVNKRIPQACFLNQRVVESSHREAQIDMLDPLFIPDESAWPKLIHGC